MMQSKSTAKGGTRIATVAPIKKMLGTGSTAKSGTGFGSVNNKSSGKSSKTLLIEKGGSNAFGGGKSEKPTGAASSSAFGGKTSKPSDSSLSFGAKSSKKDSNTANSTPLFLESKRSTAFATSPSKSYASPSFPTPKTSTKYGILWIPTKRRNKKKDYVHVSHNYDGRRERSPSMYHYDPMPGESQSHQPFKKKDEDSNLLVLERPKGPIATAASAGTVVATVETTQDKGQSTTLDEKHEQLQSKEAKEAAGDALPNKDGKKEDILENDSLVNKSTDTWENEKGDKVDSVFLRPPPPHKVQSSTSNNEEEDCGIKCLYYTLQCCDCVLM